MNELLPEYPKLFQESDIKCYCYIENPWTVSSAKPADTLCKNCQIALKYFQDQYQELIHKQTIGE